MKSYYETSFDASYFMFQHLESKKHLDKMRDSSGQANNTRGRGSFPRGQWNNRGGRGRGGDNPRGRGRGDSSGHFRGGARGGYGRGRSRGRGNNPNFIGGRGHHANSFGGRGNHTSSMSGHDSTANYGAQHEAVTSFNNRGRGAAAGNFKNAGRGGFSAGPEQNEYAEETDWGLLAQSYAERNYTYEERFKDYYGYNNTQYPSNENYNYNADANSSAQRRGNNNKFRGGAAGKAVGGTEGYQQQQQQYETAEDYYSAGYGNNNFPQGAANEYPGYGGAAPAQHSQQYQDGGNKFPQQFAAPTEEYYNASGMPQAKSEQVAGEAAGQFYPNY